MWWGADFAPVVEQCVSIFLWSDGGNDTVGDFAGGGDLKFGNEEACFSAGCHVGVDAFCEPSEFILGEGHGPSLAALAFDKMMVFLDLGDGCVGGGDRVCLFLGLRRWIPVVVGSGSQD
jgi:hypothetical protein